MYYLHENTRLPTGSTQIYLSAVDTQDTQSSLTHSPPPLLPSLPIFGLR